MGSKGKRQKKKNKTQRVYKVETTYKRGKSGKTVAKKKRRLIKHPKKNYPFVQKKGNRIITYDYGNPF